MVYSLGHLIWTLSSSLNWRFILSQLPRVGGGKGEGSTQGNQQRFSLPRWTKLYHFVHHFWRKRTPLIFNTQEDNSYSADTKQVFKKCWTVNTTYHCIKDESNPKIIFCESNNFHYTSIWKGLWSQGKPPKKVGTLSQTRNRSFLFFWATLRGSSLAVAFWIIQMDNRLIIWRHF